MSKQLLSCFCYAVGHGDEGVCLLLQIGPYRILLDCGLRDIHPLQVNPTQPADLVFCSHAHSDHARGLLAFHLAFPQIPIYGSEVTTRLLPLHWPKVPEITAFCQPLQWRNPVYLFADLSAEIIPAGHLPGAAVLLLSYITPKRTYKVLYTGDFSLSNFQLVEGLSVELLRGLAPDVLIIEGSYGTARHPHRRQQEKQLMSRIYNAIANQQNVLLPVPLLGIGQELLKLLRSHHQFTGNDFAGWVDGHVVDACEAYPTLRDQFPASVQNFAKHQPLFWDERICPRLRRLTPEHLTTLGQTPSIVVTDNQHDWSEYCQRGSWLIMVPEQFLIPAPPLGRTLSDIELETYLLAEHSDCRNTTQLIHNLRPQHIVFVHGSPTRLEDLTNLEELQSRYQLHSPRMGTLVELPIGERFVQPTAPSPSSYEGEINDQGTYVTITLPDSLTQDTRWYNFADTGLVEARWQGEELLLRGLSQRELLSQVHTKKLMDGLECCRVCRHCRSQRCWNPASPLYGFKVTSDGYCPVYEPIERSP